MKNMNLGKVKGALRSNRGVQALAVFMVAIMVLSVVLLWSPAASTQYAPPDAQNELPEEFYVLVDEPKDEDGMAFVAALSSIQFVNGNYHPMFVLDNGQLDDHQLATVQTMSVYDAPFLLFTDSLDTQSYVEDQLGVDDVITYPADDDILATFQGFQGHISVASYAEAMWAAPLAQVENKVIILGQRTFISQEDVWNELISGHQLDPNYIVITNPIDYMTTPFNEYHIASLSAVAASLAAGHTGDNEAEGPGTTALVLTDWDAVADATVGYMDAVLNAHSIGLYLKLRDMWATFGPFEYVCLVGSGAAVPQFKFPDETDPSPQNTEGDGLVSSDSAYGFLDDDPYTMDTAVGRVINLNVQGVSNQISRTFGYDYIDRVVTVETSTGQEMVDWSNKVSIWNGFEVADQRKQMTPGRFMIRDATDEGMEWEYIRTSGNEGLRDFYGKEVDMQPVLTSSGLLVYRGHGSWHATFYVYEPNEAHTRGRLEGWVKVPGDPTPSLHDLYMPPSTALLFSCENAKIDGINWGDFKVDLDLTFSLNWFYSGAVGLVASTEVSFSRIGQDIFSWIGEITGDHDWDHNNAMYAFNVDAMMNHEETYGTVGKALQWAENRYIANHDNQVDPFHQDPQNPDWTSDLGADWKTVCMYAAYGDPAHRPGFTTPGANDYDPWHNGPDDK
jgi:hypothetical protein